MLIKGPGNFENQWTTAVMSMMQRVLIASQDTLGYNEFHSIVVNRYPMNRTSLKPAGPSCDGGPEKRPACWKFAAHSEGNKDKLLVRHMTVIG